ncbi:LANO_0D03730g1_1 [Lachancea nothofagi CBS 11611]|uniref:LANO_0D03730g1_1 n=1 Tax=Lachancea nothofagi CBS 11611 TaxID=1266666 RepID=A0A1G4JFV5_9SACH|nr:LANO_0D03730g1_1 [Lachancea nothofagi CBS 11611]
MNGYSESDEEDNNPFAGTNHLYASGIAAVPEGQDDFVPPTILADVQEKEETRDELMSQLFGDVIDKSKHIDLDDSEAAGETWQSEPHEVDPPFLNKNRSPDSGRIPSFYLPVEGQKVNIVDAGHFRDAYGKYAIGYTIEFEGKQVVRRYSEFDTLRHALHRLLPTVIVPPIPSKHPLIRYFLNPLSAEKDIRIIDRRKRLLSLFLNNCYSVREVREHIVFLKFLDPEQTWRNVINSPPISIIPANNLLAPPLQPTKPSPLHLLLPSTAPNNNALEPIDKDDNVWDQEERFKEYELMLRNFEKVLNPLEKNSKQNRIHFQALASSLAELGAYYNAFSLEGNILTIQENLQQIDELSKGIEKVGQAIDVTYVSSEIVSEQITILIEEPVAEMIQSIVEARHVLHFREQKMGQYRVVDSTIKRRKLRIKNLEAAQEQMLRLEEALRKNAEESPTVAQAVKNMDGQVTTPGALTPANSNLQASTRNARSGNGAGWTGLFKSRKSRSISSRRPRSSSNAHELEPHLLTDEERKEEVTKISQELQKLNDCFKLIAKDVTQVNESVNDSLSHLIHYLKERCAMILKSFAHVLLVWLKDSLVAWQNARALIEGIKVSS